jgi:CheY-like chemotaxis protein
MKKILLVENDAFLIGIYTNQLRKSGYSVSIALDGEVAISRIKNISPDLLILDINLPKMDGLSVLKTLREDIGFKDLKVIMLSNFNQKEKINDTLGFGVLKYFLKAENTAEEIVEEIKQILG